MLFNSYIFILLFLPITLTVFYLLKKRGCDQWLLGWLFIASLFFYGWWKPAYLLLMLGSIGFNFFMGRRISSCVNKSTKKTFTGFTVILNLLLLGYFKYTNFTFGLIGLIVDTSLPQVQIVLPLAISFFTFQQIAFIIDCYQGKTEEVDFLQYGLFVSFFPQLIAGPIVHHRDMLPQFKNSFQGKSSVENLSVGLTIFTLGLFKKVMIADTMANYASPVFRAVEQGNVLTFFEAWSGVLAYSMQIYFDFSGYSDMATGLGRMFGIRLPINFFSPYKSASMIDFWRRWHITLSQFLKDYLYIPLGGNQKGSKRRYINIMITMLLGGLWHGANVTFILWGGLHGLYILINHAWRQLTSALGLPSFLKMVARPFAVLLTFLAVTVAWIFFRADNPTSAFQLLLSMSGHYGVSLWETNFHQLNKLFGFGNLLMSWGVTFGEPTYFRGIKHLAIIISTLIFAWSMPNTFELMRRYNPNTNLRSVKAYINKKQWLHWRPTFLWAVGLATLFAWSLLSISKASEFIYFQF
ncbi:MAG: MBOAT family protein [Candidatus Omnitrophica bacterium]|nr:MBOAT family protein [Candidatus Omnitrophota bacterium]